MQPSLRQRFHAARYTLLSQESADHAQQEMTTTLTASDDATRRDCRTPNGLGNAHNTPQAAGRLVWRLQAR
jgi:hypothetical protein